MHLHCNFYSKLLGMKASKNYSYLKSIWLGFINFSFKQIIPYIIIHCNCVDHSNKEHHQLLYLISTAAFLHFILILFVCSTDKLSYCVTTLPHKVEMQLWLYYKCIIIKVTGKKNNVKWLNSPSIVGYISTRDTTFGTCCCSFTPGPITKRGTWELPSYILIL